MSSRLTIRMKDHALLKLDMRQHKDLKEHSVARRNSKLVVCDERERVPSATRGDRRLRGMDHKESQSQSQSTVCSAPFFIKLLRFVLLGNSGSGLDCRIEQERGRVVESRLGVCRFSNIPQPPF